MSNLSTFYKPAVTAADLNLGTSDNVTFGSVIANGGALNSTTIGSTTPAAGSFTTLTANNGTLTASAPVLDLAQTWNNAATTFNGISLAITDTASANTSRFLSITSGGNTVFSVGRSNAAQFTEMRSDAYGFIFRTNAGTIGLTIRPQFSMTGIPSTHRFVWGADVANLNYDVALERDAAATLALRNGTNAQTFNIYNTYTSSTNHERGFLRWSSNVFQIGTEKGSGGGTARALEFQTDGTTRLTIATTGQVTASTQINTPIIRSTTTWLDISDSASGPRFGFFSHGGLLLRDSGYFGWNSSGTIVSGSTGDLRLYRSGAGILRVQSDTSDFNRLQFGGTTSSFPALKRDSTVLQARLADDSGFAPLQGQLRTHANAVTETITADKTLTLYDAAGTAYKVPCVAA